MNWQGLLNWSMQYTDGTRPSEFKPMDEETKTWLKGALQSMMVNEADILRKGSLILSELETGSEEECMRKEHSARSILETVENLDSAVNLVKIDGFKHVIRCMIGSQYPLIRKLCASIFTTSVQNNPPVQRNAILNHALDGLFAIIPEEKDLQLKEQYVSCLSGIVRGEFNEGREKFLDIGGLELIHRLLLEFQSVRIVKKTLLLLSDILHHSSSKGLDGVSQVCIESGILETVASFSASEDGEIVEMAKWAIHNSMMTST